MIRQIKNNFTVFLKTKFLLCCYSIKKYLLIFILFFFISPLTSSATEKNLEYKVKAAYLYNFTKFITWPDKVLSVSSKENLNVCILGKDPFGEAIALLSNKLAKGHTVIVKYIDKLKTDTQCHIAYVSRSKEKNIISIIKKLSNKNILSVSDIDGFAVKGGCISLVVLNGKVRFNVNLQATYNADLKLSAKLLEMAKLVIE